MKLKIKVSPLDKPRNWVLDEDVEILEMRIKAGFCFDGASIPVGLRWLLPHGGAQMPAALYHDFMYKHGKIPDKKGVPSFFVSRRQADIIFKKLLLYNGVPRWKVYLMYYGLRIGGWLAWYNHRRKDNA